MIRKLIYPVIIAALAAALLVSALDAPPSTEDLDADIAALKNRISEATKRRDEFSGGLLKSLIDVRIEILSSTQAMLEAKRASILRRVSLTFHIDGSEFKSTKSLSDIQADIASAQKRAAAAEAEAARNSGGLLQVLQISKAATEDVTVAQLNSAYYSAKYGLRSIGAFVLKNDSNDRKPSPAGKIVNDKDAL